MDSFDYTRTEAALAAAAYNERAKVGELRQVRALDVIMGGIVAGRLGTGPYESTVVGVEILDYRGPHEARRFKLANGVSFTLPADDTVTARMPSARRRVHCDAHTKDRPVLDRGHLETSRCHNARPV